MKVNSGLSRNRVFLLIISMLLYQTIQFQLLAQSAELPDTPSAQAFSRLLQQLDRTEDQAFIMNEYEPEFRDGFSMEQHLGFLREVREEHGNLVLHQIKHVGPQQMNVIVRGVKSNQWLDFELSVSPDPPYKIVGMGLRPGRDPNAPKRVVTVKRPLNDGSIISGRIGRELDSKMLELERDGYSGAVLAARKGEILLARGYGYADRSTSRLFDRNTVFPIGSITKQFTGAAILKLEMMGKLSVMDPLTKYFPDLPQDKQGLTIHHLLTHSAGLPGALGDDFEKYTRQDLIDQFRDFKLKSAPGEVHRYSNVGFSLAAAIVEMVSGVSYDEFTVKYLFEPAGMMQTGYVLPKWDLTVFAHGYRGEEEWGTMHSKNRADDGPWWHLRGNGGTLSTIEDMYRWHVALGGSTILSDAAKQKLYGKHILEDSGDTWYGYGWVITETRRGTPLITHNGGNGYFTSDFYRFPQEDIVLFITSNDGEMRAFEPVESLLKILFAEQ